MNLLTAALPVRGWLAAVVVSLLLAAGAAVFVANRRADRAQDARALAEARLAMLAAQVEAQNAAVAAANQRLAQYAKAAASAARNAAAVNKQLKSRLAALEAAPVPKDCPGAMAWQAEYGAAFGKEWQQGGGK